MVITYLGGECFKITQGDLTLAFNPPSKDSDIKASKFGSDIVLVSQDHPDYNGVENASFGERSPFVISGPGEYEVRGVAVRGFASTGVPSTSLGASGSESVNTIYSVMLENTNLCFLGALSDSKLPAAASQELDDIDILFVPVGGPSAGGGVLDKAAAYKLAVSLEPKAIVPMHYDDASLKAFLKEAGVEKPETQEKLTVKKKDLEGKEGEIIVLKS
jgi:L-ascorbate metabolism protein UlaG (beta-lactamase superfamily)